MDLIFPTPLVHFLSNRNLIRHVFVLLWTLLAFHNLRNLAISQESSSNRSMKLSKYGYNHEGVSGYIQECIDFHQATEEFEAIIDTYLDEFYYGLPQSDAFLFRRPYWLKLKFELSEFENDLSTQIGMVKMYQDNIKAQGFKLFSFYASMDYMFYDVFTKKPLLVEKVTELSRRQSDCSFNMEEKSNNYVPQIYKTQVAINALQSRGMTLTTSETIAEGSTNDNHNSSRFNVDDLKEMKHLFDDLERLYNSETFTTDMIKTWFKALSPLSLFRGVRAESNEGEVQSYLRLKMQEIPTAAQARKASLEQFGAKLYRSTTRINEKKSKLAEILKRSREEINEVVRRIQETTDEVHAVLKEAKYDR